ncbi:MAG TPA: DNA polymerase III subunit delta [Acetobacteraceae bacterium]|nr:DNA polymerase III subunit delta [Acetobacteraceae bacterium]
MKLEARRVPGFLAAPPATCRVILLHGSDDGLIRLRAEAVTRAVIGAADDPFRVAWLGRDEAGRIPEEVAAQSMIGGRRVVRLRDAGDAASGPLERALAAGGEALVVLEGGELPARSKLRALVERREDAASIGCYPLEGRAARAWMAEMLRGRGVVASEDALAWLGMQLGADHAVAVAELDKAALYAGADGRLDLAAARESVGDVAEASLEDALFAATEGDAAGADRALSLALAQGTTPIGVLRAALLHLQRLHRAELEVSAGGDIESAARQARPPVFFRRAPAFRRALGLWPGAALLPVMQHLLDAELACKRTGAPDALICRNAVFALARLAARRRAGGRSVSAG